MPSDRVGDPVPSRAPPSGQHGDRNARFNDAPTFAVGPGRRICTKCTAQGLDQTVSCFLSCTAIFMASSKIQCLYIFEFHGWEQLLGDQAFMIFAVYFFLTGKTLQTNVEQRLELRPGNACSEFASWSSVEFQQRHDSQAGCVKQGSVALHTNHLLTVSRLVHGVSNRPSLRTSIIHTVQPF